MEGGGHGRCSVFSFTFQFQVTVRDVAAADDSDGQPRGSDFAPAMAVSVPCALHVARCEGEAASSV
jgi:hypothetical protein